MKKILIVDDDPDIRMLYRKIIMNYFTELAIVMGINGDDGWREFQESQPILVITDLKMEFPDAGFQLAQRIKESNPKVPVILITSNEESKDRSFFDCVILKPVDTEVLVETIKKFLRKETKR